MQKRISLGIVGFVFVAVGCQTSSEAPPPAPPPAAPAVSKASAAQATDRKNVVIEVTPARLDFGTVALGGNAELTVRFENKGPDVADAATVWLYALDSKGAGLNVEGGPSPFTVVNNECTGAAGAKARLAVGESCTAVIRYRPTVAKASNAQVLFAAVGPTNLAAVPLSGQGQ